MIHTGPKRKISEVDWQRWIDEIRERPAKTETLFLEKLTKPPNFFSRLFRLFWPREE